ncbi:MAG: hypothetical protein AB7O97_21425 [Planctomycetota bacterium]
MSSLAAFRALALTAAVTGLVAGASAQCFDPAVGALVGHGDDSPLQAIQSLGITFPFAGSTFTDVHINNNGMVYLSNGGVPAPGTATGYSSSASTLSTNLRSGTQAKIAAFWDDLNNVAANGGGVMIDNTLGDRCVITWDNTVEFSQSVQKDIQLVLWATGAIDFVYNAGCDVQTGTALVGCGVGGDADPGQTDLSAGASTTAFTVYQTFAAADLFDLAGKAVRFTPNNFGGFDVSTECQPAAAAVLGVGCGGTQASFYELFSGAGADDLAGTTVTAVENGNGGYDVSAAPLGAFVAPTSPGLALGDEAQSAPLALGFGWEGPAGTITDVVVESNGRVLLSGTDGTDFNPTVGELLGDAVAQIAVSWADLRPDGATNVDNVFFETDGVGEARITWVNVPHFTAANGVIDVQLVLLHTAAAGGDGFELRYLNVLGNATHLVGFSLGSGAADPGNADLGVAAFSTAADAADVALSMSAAPVAGTSVLLATDNMPASTVLALTILGMVPDLAGTELLPGGDGCFAHLSLTGGEVGVMLTALPSDAVSLAIPAAPFFLGLDFYAQTACFAPVNPLALVTSNAVHGHIEAF